MTFKPFSHSSVTFMYGIQCKRILSSPRPLLLLGSLVRNAPNPFTVPKNFFKTSISIWDKYIRASIISRKILLGHDEHIQHSSHDAELFFLYSHWSCVGPLTIHFMWTFTRGLLKFIPTSPIFPAPCLHAGAYYHQQHLARGHHCASGALNVLHFKLH